MKVHLIDGTFELFRAHFGAPSATNREGMEIGATRGLLRSMAALLRDSETTHIAFAFDTTIESFRNDLYDGYKTGEGMEPVLFAQFSLAQRAAKALGITLWPMIEFEADDALATAAIRYAVDERVSQVRICSPDKDLCQVVGNKIVTVDRIRKREYDTAAVIEKFGIEPKSIADYLALVGDKADGIPGLARWGAKSSATVLAHYHSIEKIPDDEGQWPFKLRGAKSLAAVLRENRDDANLFKLLATLRLDVPLTESLDDISWSGPDVQKLQELCEELEMSPPKLPS